MYNIDFLPQIEAFRRHLSGNLSEGQIEEARRRYVPPNDVEVIKCVEAPNGEWVPPNALEKKAE